MANNNNSYSTDDDMEGLTNEDLNETGTKGGQSSGQTSESQDDNDDKRGKQSQR